MGVFDVFKKKDGDLGVVQDDSGAPPEHEPEKKAADTKQDAPADKTSADGKRLLFFYGEECPHCHKLMPRIEEVEKDLGVTFERFEVWHDQKNAEMLKEYDRGFCGGVPFLYNTATNDWICGAVETDKVHAFASKE